MIQIDDTIISLDVFEKHFVCDLNACKGACCVEGDSGAPITDVENKQIESLINDIKRQSLNFKISNKDNKTLKNSLKNDFYKHIRL